MSSNPNDPFVSPAPGQPRLPESGTNNFWYQDRGTDAALVFVHGIFSDSRSCWLSEGPLSVYWPDLVSRDRRFDRYSLYLGGYYTALDAGAFKVQHCADELYRALARPDRPDVQSVLQRSTLVFVCHSTGGIVIRYLLESRAAEFKEKTLGLVLIASPSFGSAWATKLSWLSEFYNAQLARQLEWGNNSLDDLDERFHRLIKERRIPHLLGVEAYENHFVFHRKFLPDRLVVVDKNSAGRYFAPGHLLARTDHFTSVKPDSDRHPAHELLVDFCSELERYQHQHAGAMNAPERTFTPATADEGSISRETDNKVRAGQSPKTVAIFFSCPGDVGNEKSKLIQIVEEMNPSFARHWITLMPWTFEKDSLPGVATPGGSVQTVIDRQLPRMSDGSIAYDLFVGIMDRRIGTPLKDAPSGTVHEFLEAKQSFETSGKPHILFYFRARESSAILPDPQIEGVLRFKSQYPGLFATYTSVEDLETQFRRHLLTELLDLLQPNTSHEYDWVADDSWDRIISAYATIRDSYLPTFLDNSPVRVGRILRQLNLLFGSERQLRSRERRILMGALLSLLLNESDRPAFELSAGGSPETAAEIRDSVTRSLDPSKLAVRPLGPVRLDLIGAFAMIGLRLDLTRSAIAVGATTLTPPAETSDEWLAFLTDEIICERGIVRFHLLAPSIDWVEPLKCATAVALEAIWQRARTVLTRHGFSFAVSRSRVEVDDEVVTAPPVALAVITESARQAVEALPNLPHFGHMKLPSLEALLPLPFSKIRAPVTFRAPMSGPVRLLVDGTVIAEEPNSSVIAYYPPVGSAVDCILECDEAGEFVPVIKSSLQRLSPIEAGILDSDSLAPDTMRLLHLWNDLLASIWPMVLGTDPNREDLAIAYHLLRNAFEELSGTSGAVLARRDTYWDAMEIVQRSLER
jgi:hypothetical protein